jgi:hypothetical protein
MFNWKAELELAKRQVAELEEGVARLREETQPSTADARQAIPIELIVERNQRILTVRMASLERAKFHQRFIEQKIAIGVKAAKPLPYLELAEVCFIDGCHRGRLPYAGVGRPSTPRPLRRKSDPRLTPKRRPSLRTHSRSATFLKSFINFRNNATSGQTECEAHASRNDFWRESFQHFHK